MNDYEYDDAPLLIDEVDAPQPFWTRRRIFLTLFAILIVAALLAYSYYGLFVPTPQPTPVPRPMV